MLGGGGDAGQVDDVAAFVAHGRVGWCVGGDGDGAGDGDLQAGVDGGDEGVGEGDVSLPAVYRAGYLLVDAWVDVCVGHGVGL